MAKTASFGAELAWDSSGGSSYTAIAQVRSIKPPMVENDEIEVTTHDSTGGYREFIAAPLKDGGEVEIELVWDPDAATHDATTGLLSGAVSADIATFRLTFPDGTIWYFPGFVKTFEPGALDTDNEMTATVTIRVSGAPTLA
jgi:predicted secreted protein